MSSLYSRQKGSVSILFVLLLFSVFALLGAVVDLGAAKTAQSAMQNSADTAALTGLRFRDSALTEEDRRREAARDAARTFSHQVYGDPRIYASEGRNPGAGGIVELDAGMGTVHAGQLVTLPAQTGYLPGLELNMTNLQHGDMVSGNYDQNRIHTPGVLSDPAHDESAGYEKEGLTPDAAEPYDGNSFLVRLRRTPDQDGLDLQPGVSSSGPPLPLLFTRGAAIRYDETYDLGGEGLTARATAIAFAKAVKIAGRPQAGMKGVTPFVLDRTFWDGLVIPSGSESVSIALRVEADGQIIEPGSGSVTGQFLFTDTASMTAVQVGRVVAASAVPASNALLNADGYAPVADSFSGTRYVIGFGRAQMTLTDADGLAPYDVSFTKFRASVADENASAVASVFAGLAPDVIEFLISSNQREGQQLSEALSAPLLTR